MINNQERKMKWEILHLLARNKTAVSVRCPVSILLPRLDYEEASPNRRRVFQKMPVTFNLHHVKGKASRGRLSNSEKFCQLPKGYLRNGT